MYIYIYIYIYTHMHIYVCGDIHTCVNMYMEVCLNT